MNVSSIGGFNPVILFPTTEAKRMTPPTFEKLLSLRKNSESVRKTDWIILALEFEALSLSNSELGSDSDAIAPLISENDKLLLSSFELDSLKLLMIPTLKTRPGKLSGSTSCTATANDSRISITCVSFSGMGKLAVMSSINFRSLLK